MPYKKKKKKIRSSASLMMRAVSVLGSFIIALTVKFAEL